MLLPGSIGDNIRIGTARRQPGRHPSRRSPRPGWPTSSRGCHEGLDTPLGEGGSGLSTGEARRIAIARAFLTDAALWVLDEPTAHLDADTEAQVIVALRTATRGRTVIVATHSAALARCADHLFSLADGTVHPVREAATV